MAIIRVTQFKAFPGKEEALVQQLIENVRVVRDAVPGLLYISTGPTIGGNSSYHSTIVAKYKDQAAFDVYESHPAHLSTKANMDGYVQERLMMIYQVADED